MANTIGAVNSFLKSGANSVESDVNFLRNGKLYKIYHGFPCDAGRYCWSSSDPVIFFEQLRSLSEEGREPYHKNLTLIMLDLKLNHLSPSSKMVAGTEIADKLARTIFREVSEGGKYQPLNVLLSIQITWDYPFVAGFKRAFFEKLGFQAEKLYNRYIGWDDNSNDRIDLVNEMWKRSGAGPNIWQGNGITNVLSWYPNYLHERLQLLLNDRFFNGTTHKVYSWTLDYDYKIRNTISMGVDGIVSNYVNLVSQALTDPLASRTARFATREDNPWTRFVQPLNYGSQVLISIESNEPKMPPISRAQNQTQGTETKTQNSVTHFQSSTINHGIS
ncbi:dermonecrotic toxin LcsSicTox-betaIC1-like [Brevipalpus obovatus]|uniref:dermonecrotic toxin LcsSicTox-betaIC1-like n=1 Tax=Brevipalpus obovatus TaxID=246614 RepID=UPI003D9F9DDF